MGVSTTSARLKPGAVGRCRTRRYLVEEGRPLACMAAYVCRHRNAAWRERTARRERHPGPCLWSATDRQRVGLLVLESLVPLQFGLRRH
jgi:hypothetical protein